MSADQDRKPEETPSAHSGCAAMPGSVSQEMVEAIIKRAQASPFGLDPAEVHPRMASYHPQNLDNLALALVSGWHAKYDLVSVFAAALHEVAARASQNVPALAQSGGEKTSTKESNS